MSKRIPTGITREYLESVALPNHGGRYTPISHKSIIDKVHEELDKRGFNVESELYRASIGGNVANGIYILDQGTDPDMKMMFVWGNSYDKSMRFKCGIGVYIPKTGNYIFAGNISSYARKHTGKADEEAIQMIQTQLNMANVHYADLVASRDILINQTASIRTYSELIGRMFIEKEILNKEQVSTVRDQIVNEVALLDNLTWDNAWNFYNYVATALRMSHPKNWFENQSDTHNFITAYFGLTAITQMVTKETITSQDVQEAINSQLSILDVIDEIMNEERPIESMQEPMSDEVLIHMYTDEDKSEEKVEKDADDFVNFGEQNLPTFDLPDL
jgi:hypothetical protein